MKTQLVLLFGILGILMGFLSVKGLTKGIEPILWLVLGIFTTIIIARNITEKWFIVIIIIGVLWGFFNAVMQSLFLDEYLANNPDYASSFRKAPVNPRLFVLVTGPLIGLATGLVLAFMIWL